MGERSQLTPRPQNGPEQARAAQPRARRAVELLAFERTERAKERGRDHVGTRITKRANAFRLIRTSCP